MREVELACAPARNLDLLVEDVAREAHHLHTIEEWPRDGLSRVGRAEEEHLGASRERSDEVSGGHGERGATRSAEGMGKGGRVEGVGGCARALDRSIGTSR